MKLKNVSFNWLETRSPRDRPALGTSLAITSSQVDIRQHHGRSRHFSQVISLKGPQAHGHALLPAGQDSPSSPSRPRGDDMREFVLNRMIGQFEKIPTSRKLFVSSLNVAFQGSNDVTTGAGKNRSLSASSMGVNVPSSRVLLA